MNKPVKTPNNSTVSKLGADYSFNIPLDDITGLKFVNSTHVC